MHKFSMNKLPTEKRVQILSMLCEGSSMRSTSRVADVSLNTVDKLLRDAGEACAAFHDEHVRGVKARKVQCDEIWSFTYCKQRAVATAKAAPEVAGDTWTWTGLRLADKETEMIDLYYWPTPNGHKITMFLEEAGVDYTIHPVDVSAGDQFKPGFLAISPNNRTPELHIG